MNNNLVNGLVLSVFILVSGCATNSKFSCNAPEGVGCLSTKEVYETTHDGKNNTSAPITASTEKATSAPRTKYDPTIHMPFVAIEADRPVPVRVPAKTMRIYISAFQDNEGRLYSAHYVFNDVVQREWLLSETNVTRTERLGMPLSE